MTISRAFLPCVLTTASMLASPALAQNAGAGASASGGGWRVTPSISTTEEFDNNVFLLRDGRKNDLGGASAGIGARYADMTSASDIITTLRGAIALERQGFRGKPLTVKPELGYELYARNGARSGAQMGIAVEQELKRGRLARMRASMTPRTFFKNYLADAVDRDGDGSIAPGERLYAPDEQGELKLGADYTHRLDKSSRTNPFGAAIRVGAGWYNQSNSTLFTSRDLSGPTLDLALLLKLTADTRVTVGYDLEALSAPRVENVVLLDEAKFGEDFNGNMTTDDIDVRSVRMVDRSRMEHELGVEVESRLSRAVDVGLSLAQRRRTFSSVERYDVASNGRRDSRNEIGGELRYRLSSPLRLRVAAAYASQTLNRANATASTGDVADYTRLRGSVGLTLRY